MGLVRAMIRGAWRGVRLRCPECRRGRMFERRFTMRDRCPACGYEFLPGRGEFTGALMLAQGFFMVTAALAYVFLRIRTDWNPTAIAVGLLLFLVVAPILAYSRLKGVWVGLLHGSVRA